MANKQNAYIVIIPGRAYDIIYSHTAEEAKQYVEENYDVCDAVLYQLTHVCDWKEI